MRCVWSILAACIAAASPAQAQDVSLPLVEIGAGYSAVIPVAPRDGPAIVVGLGPRLAVNVTPRIGIELLAEVIRPYAENSGTLGQYVLQARFPFRQARAGRHVYSVTAGAVGPIWYRPSVHPRAPNTATIGLARDALLGNRASGNLSVQAFVGPVGGLAIRAAASLSFGVKGRRMKDGG
jgi:hypothetical protein